MTPTRYILNTKVLVLLVLTLVCFVSLESLRDVYQMTVVKLSDSGACKESCTHNTTTWKDKTTLAHMVRNYRNMEYTPFKFVNYLGNRNIPAGLKEADACNYISHESKLAYANVTKFIRPNFKVLSESVKKTDPRWHDFLKGIAGDKSIDDTLDKKWFMFGSSAEWLEEEQCYVVYSRLIISKEENREHPSISLVAAQAFDKDWKEIYGKRIKYIDVETPENLDEQFKAIEMKYNLTESCMPGKSAKTLPKNKDPQFDEQEHCLKQLEARFKMAKEEKEELIAKYYRVYPTVLDIPFKATGNLDYMGPEDPKILIRRNHDGQQEPIVVYNMQDNNYEQRLMFVVLPHRKINPIVPLVDKEYKIGGTQKNWTPFIHEGDATSDGSRGFMHVVQHMSPTSILKCSLDNGKCKYIFDAAKIPSLKDVGVKELRGGSAFVKIPHGIPELDGRNLWIAMIKSHQGHCGISFKFYRPHLAIMEEKDGKFSMLSYSSALHFDRDVLSWDGNSTYAGYINIMSPNSIVSWNIISHNHENDTYEDYMELSFSESDYMSYVVTVRGVLDYILQVLRDGSDRKFLDWTSKDLATMVGTPPKCVRSNLKQHCSVYGNAHKEDIPKKLYT
ncbi:Hypothetical protein J6898_00331 [Nakaseomyces glabratus]|nr:Beta-mannosyltransferase 1 [Nakaseomyces glabratus]